MQGPPGLCYPSVMDVHLRELRYFVAVAEHLHFTLAAEALYVSQPALSKQIRALEAQLRTPLFARNRRTVQLTPDGEALLPHARSVLEGWARAQTALSTASGQRQTTLVVGISTGLGRGLLPAVRARLTESAPAARLHVRQIGWADATGGLAANGQERTDAAFVWLPVPDPESYEWAEVLTEPRVIALPAAHPLADRDDLDITDVLDEPFLALPVSSGMLRDYWLATEERRGAPVRIGAEVTGAEETVEALIAGLGVCLLSEGNAPLIARDGVAIRPISGVGPSHLALVWRRGDNRPLLGQLRDAVTSTVTGEPG
jgi:DNA-binding transcriptional LysR family regulator